MSLVVALLLWYVLKLSCDASTLPEFITYSVTVRDFIAQGCRQGLPGFPDADSYSIIKKWCPLDSTIRQQVLEEGTISGHPDFQRDTDPDRIYILYGFDNDAISAPACVLSSCAFNTMALV